MSSRRRVPFNRPAVTGREAVYLEEVFENQKFGGGGPFGRRCDAWLQSHFEAPLTVATTSCTAALEIAALLCDLKPEEEVILPSFAFPGTATAFARAGAKLVFVDVEAATMNIDVDAVEAAITPRTRLVVALHYAGVACRMKSLSELCREHGLILVEDAAQTMFSEYRGRKCGTLGTFGCISFHETKNVQCGSGGALIVNDPDYVDRAQIILEKGTNRREFARGEIDKYTWRDVGSSYVPNELTCAFLLAQLEGGDQLTRERLEVWSDYSERLAPLAVSGTIELATVPEDRRHNGHILWIKNADETERRLLIQHLDRRGVQAVFHYVPLHTSHAGMRFGRFEGDDRATTKDAARLLRLPLFSGLTEAPRVVKEIHDFYSGAKTSARPR